MARKPTRSTTDQAATTLQAWQSRVTDYLAMPNDPADLTRLRNVVIHIARILRGVAIDIGEGQLSLRAMGLVYTTLLSLVPLLAISFSVLKGFGVHNQIEPILLNMLEPLGEKAAEITTQIISFVDNTQVGVLGALGIALLFYTVLSLMQKIEAAFNQVWRVTEQRSWAQRFRDYLSVIVVGPSLLVLSLGAVTGILNSDAVGQVVTIPPFTWIVTLLTALIPSLLMIGALAFIYAFVPNTRVGLRSAAIGGLVAAVLWTLLGDLFTTFVASSSGYVNIYAGFATPLIFMIWLYLNWLILLIGASVAFYDQHPAYATRAGHATDLSNRVREHLALLIAQAVGRAFYDNDVPHSMDSLARRLRAPAPAIQRVCAILEKDGFLRRTGDYPARLLPARPWDTTSVADLLSAVRRGVAGQAALLETVPLGAGSGAIAERIDSAIAASVEGLTLKDLADPDSTRQWAATCDQNNTAPR